MNRVYKEATTSETIFKIKDLLNKAGILVYESLVNNPHKGIYSTRTQTLQSQGNIGQNGKGVTLKYALASGYAELIERLENECISGGRALPITFLKRLKEEFGYYFFPDEKMISEKNFYHCLPMCWMIYFRVHQKMREKNRSIPISNN